MTFPPPTGAITRTCDLLHSHDLNQILTTKLLNTDNGKHMTHVTGGAINRVSRTTEVDMYTIDRIGFTILCIHAMAYLSNDFKGFVNSME